MKFSIKKLLAIAIMLPAILLILGSGFYFYLNFTQYQKVKQSENYVELAKKLENILVALGEERETSSIYFISKGEFPNSAELVKEKRIQTNKAVNSLKSYISKHPELYNKVKNLLDFTNQLPVVRHKIDTFKDIKYKDWFFGYYTVMENQIIATLHNLTKKFPKSLQALYEQKIPFEKITAYTGVLSGFMSYYITADIPLSQKDYENVLLKYYHDSNILPLEILKNTPVYTKFASPQYKKLQHEIKEVLFYIQQANMDYYSNNNKDFEGYPIDPLDYFNVMSKRIKYFKYAINYYNNQINKQSQIILKKAKLQLLINSLIFAFSILILIIGYYINKTIKSHISSLSNLISDLTPITGEELKLDIGTAEGMKKGIETVKNAIKITQESIKKTEEAAKAKSLFLANMSHEIRTPLNGILGFLELLKTTETNPEQQEYISTIEQSAKNLLQIVNNVLDVSKIESNKISLELIDFKALDEFENTIEIFSTPAAQKEIEYVTYISPNIPSVLKGDILKIKEILTNLINNAIKFTNKNGTISVKIQYNGIKDNKANLYFEIKDTGIGMSEEQKNKIFEAFSQADESITRKYGGTGLGLTIVKNYIEMMGGEIKVESEINKGSKFYFTLDFDVVDKVPRYLPESLKNETFAIMHTNTSSLRKDVSIEYLNYFGINKIGFNDIEEIKHLIQTENINAIVIFYQETDKNKIKTVMESKCKIPVICVSSYKNKEEIDRLKPEFNIYDPNTPSKTYNTAQSLKETTVRKKFEVEETPIYQLKALIAEDNPINMQLLTTTLKNMGMEVDTAQNGLEAFNKYSMNPEKYDVIFMDAQMPVMDGIEATQEIIEFEEEEELPHTPIVAVTANVLKGDRERFLGAGMDDYISKPINLQELKRVLEKISKHKYQKTYHIHNESIKKETKNSKDTDNQQNSESTSKTVNEPAKKEKLIIASESQFLINYFKHILESDFVAANSIKELSKVLDKSSLNIILIEEDFAGSDIEKLINSIKSEYPDAKFIVISERNIENADYILDDLDEEKIKETIQKATK